MKCRFEDDGLRTLRTRLAAEDELMRRGVFTDADTGREYFTGYSYKTLYDWDQYFEAIAQIYMGWPSTLIRNGVTIFLDHQRENGMISRSVPSNPFHDPEHVKPFLAQIALLVIKAYGEDEWILNDDYFPKLCRYLDYWLSDMDLGGVGLSDWMSSPHTGMDNQHERAGYWRDRVSKGVDLNSYLVRECRALAVLAERAGKLDIAARYRAEAEARAERVRTLMWDEEDGFFYDLNVKAAAARKPGLPPAEIAEIPISVPSSVAEWSQINGRMRQEAISSMQAGKSPFIRVRAVSGFFPLWSGIATPEQARRLVYDHLFNRDEFLSDYPIPALARNERWYSAGHMPNDMGCGWRAHTWIPANYMIFHGLRRYGYDQLATLLCRATERLLLKSGNREYYEAETGAGCGLDPFWGWSLLGWFMPWENQRREALCSI